MNVIWRCCERFLLANHVFTGPAPGALAPAAFASGLGLKTATDALQWALYDSTWGKFYFDADGNGKAAAPIAFAQITSAVKPALSAADFLVVGAS